MTRYAAALEYKGTNYSGWQKQKDQPSVAEAIEQALGRVANHKLEVTAAGRTDKGVHASQQVIHFDSDSRRTNYNWVQGANRLLPPDIRLHWARPVAEDFHARFSASSRRYAYLIFNSPTQPALLADYCDWQYLPLDHQLMHQAAGQLTGYHNFNCFRSTDCQSKTSYRQVHIAQVSRQDKWIRFDIEANAFLHKMVRMIVAELISIGKCQHPPERIEQLLNLGERQHKPVARARGLFLTHIAYDSSWQLPIATAEDCWLYRL